MRRQGLAFVTLPLAETVESDVVGEAEDLFDFFASIDRCKDVHFFSHFIFGKLCFV